MNFMAREGQDRWVLEKSGYHEGGYFVDIGASNGIQNNNTYVLETLYKWKGICIEPNPYERSFVALSKARSCICENLCIFSENTVVPFIARAKKHETSGILGDFSSDIIKAKVKGGHPVRQVQAITLMDLLKKHNTPPIIDYVSIDTEGSEWEILRVFDFDVYKIRMITVEHNYMEKNGFPPYEKIKKDKIQALLESKGFVLDKTVIADDWYCNEG